MLDTCTKFSREANKADVGQMRRQSSHFFSLGVPSLAVTT